MLLKKNIPSEPGRKNSRPFFSRLFRKKEHEISLNGYLRVCGMCYRAAYPDLTGKTDLELYRTFSDGRRGGMLDIKHANSVRAFGKWLIGDEWNGSHPFEILRGMGTFGIHLVPQSEKRPFFELRLGGDLWAGAYLKMADALAKSGICFEAPDLERAKGIVKEKYEKENADGKR